MNKTRSYDLSPCLQCFHRPPLAFCDMQFEVDRLSRISILWHGPVFKLVNKANLKSGPVFPAGAG